MLHEDQYMDRTPDLVARIRKMREAAENEMNKFTCIADYEVRRVVGHGPKAAPVSDETALPSPASERAKRRVTSSASVQTSIEFAPAPTERGDDEEAHP